MSAFRIINARSLKVTQSQTVLVKDKVHLKQQAPCKFGPKFCIGMQYMHAWACMQLSKMFVRDTILSQFKHVESESDLGLEPFGEELRRF